MVPQKLNFPVMAPGHTELLPELVGDFDNYPIQLQITRSVDKYIYEPFRCFV